jgi:hypothetical protein
MKWFAKWLHELEQWERDRTVLALSAYHDRITSEILMLDEGK